MAKELMLMSDVRTILEKVFGSSFTLRSVYRLVDGLGEHGITRARVKKLRDVSEGPPGRNVFYSPTVCWVLATAHWAHRDGRTMAELAEALGRIDGYAREHARDQDMGNGSPAVDELRYIGFITDPRYGLHPRRLDEAPAIEQAYAYFSAGVDDMRFVMDKYRATYDDLYGPVGSRHRTGEMLRHDINQRLVTIDVFDPYKLPELRRK